MSDAQAPEPPELFYFPHELAAAEVEFLVQPASTPPPAAAPAAATPAAATPAAATSGPSADVFKEGATSGAAWETQPLTVDGHAGVLALGFLADAWKDGAITFESSPFFFKGPPPPPAPPPKPPRPHKNLSVKGKLGINFGKDTLKITGALNAGGGAGVSAGGGAAAGAGAVAGAGGGASGGQGGNATASAKPYSINPVFRVGPLLESEESIIIAVRCILRYFYHWCDCINLSIDYFKNELPRDTDGGEAEVLWGFFKYNWWMTVFSMFAMKDMLYDIVDEHADFIASILNAIGVEAKLDLHLGPTGDAIAGVEITGTVAAKIYLPLAVMLAPFIEFLMAGSTAKVPDGAGLADKIVPFVEGTVEDRICVAAGGLPAAMLVEAKGKLATLTFSVPKGSPLRAKIEKVGKGVFKAADHYKNNRLKKITDETKIVRLILDLIDHEVRNIVRMIKAAKATVGAVQAGVAAAENMQDRGDGTVRQGDIDAGQAAAQGGAAAMTDGLDAASDALDTAVPYVKQIIDALQGKNQDEPPGLSAPAQAVIAMLKRTKVHGVPIGMSGPYEIRDNEERKLILLHVTDDEKAMIAASGFAGKAEPELETTHFEVGLPVTPAVVGWNYIAGNPDLGRDYAGIVAGFDQVADRERCKDACRSNGWVPPALGNFEDQHPDDSQGWHWAWLAVGLSEYLAAQPRPIPMPELELRGDKLRVTFDELPIGAINPDAMRVAVPLLLRAQVSQEKIWKVTLIENATGEETEAIQGDLDKNQPDEDPYAIPILDELLDQAQRFTGGP